MRGKRCECMFIDATQPFVGVEFVLPWEDSATKARGLCLPCQRATTQALYLDIMHSGVAVEGLIQRFYNRHSEPGEYRLSAMLVCPPSGPVHNLPHPIVAHRRSQYEVFARNGVRYMRQVGVDFCPAPPV